MIKYCLNLFVICSNMPYIQEAKEVGQCACGCMVGAPGTPGVPGVPGMHGHRGQDGKRGELGENGDKGPYGPPGKTRHGEEMTTGVLR